MKRRMPMFLRMLWAMPCSFVGLLLGAGFLALGGNVRRIDRTLEIALRDRQCDVPDWASRLPFLAITFGHVIVGHSHETLARLRRHERVHVRQYERLGAWFFVAYPWSSLVAWRRGKCPYRGNRFEQEAFAEGGLDTCVSKAQGAVGVAIRRTGKGH